VSSASSDVTVIDMPETEGLKVMFGLTLGELPKVDAVMPSLSG
jgi:hypothetical protein